MLQQLQMLTLIKLLNEPYFTGKETHYLYATINNKTQIGQKMVIAPKKCQAFFKSKYGLNSHNHSP
jgi:hypothetical protein